MTHNELVELAGWFLKSKEKCSVVFTEFVTCGPETPDAIGWSGFGFESILIECKSTRSDFLKDAKKWFRQMPDHGMGQRRYYLCPMGMIKPKDLPEGWGLLWATGKQRPKIQVEVIPNKKFMGAKTLERERSILVAALRRFEVRGMLDTIYEPYKEVLNGGG